MTTVEEKTEEKGERGAIDRFPEHYRSLIKSTIAPVLLSFVRWVVESALEKGIQRLYFVARDGELLLKIANQFYHDKGVEFRYLYGSRQAWLPLSTLKLDTESLHWAFRGSHQRTPKLILARIGIDVDALKQPLSDAGIPPEQWDRTLDAEGSVEFIKTINRAPLAERILADLEQRQQVAWKYFEEQGLTDASVNWALVDVGWTLTTQVSLAHFFRKMSPDVSVKAFYFGCRSHAERIEILESMEPAGGYWAWIDTVKGCYYQDFPVRWIQLQGVSSLIEDVFLMCTHKSTVGYEVCEERGEVNVVFKASADQGADSAYAKRFQQEVLDACSPLYTTLTSESGRMALSQCRDFFYKPDKPTVNDISDIIMHIDQLHDSSLTRRLASPIYWSDVLDIITFLINPKRTYLAASKHGWYMGSSALSGIGVRLIFTFIRLYWRWQDR